MEQILSEIRGFDGVLELAPQPGSEHPEISWGDHYFYFAPDARVPTNRQPYATIVTKNYLDDVESRLDAPDRWRLNIHMGAKRAAELLGRALKDISDAEVDYGAEDEFLPHPLYGAYGWVCVVNPSGSTLGRVLEVLREAHEADRRRVERRRHAGSSARRPE